MHISNITHNLIAEAFHKKASDIHLESHKNGLQIRYRIDGLLESSHLLPLNYKSLIISKIKILSGLDIAEKRLPQDGRVKYWIDDNEIDIRISICPTLYGEKIVLRLLNQHKENISIEELGMEPDDLKEYRKIVSRKSGLVLVTGPTGSGKTTTLYATLSTFNCCELNIMTIEDPIEYELKGTSQIQIANKIGLTFSNGLRTILRQDPDIIMVGEIRDLETAKIAIQSALTGHLVFSTLHTNDAKSALVRLVDMGIDEYLVKASVTGVLAQRLVRKISNDGYCGRTAIFEILSCLSQCNPQRSLLENGKIKTEKGITAKEELARVLTL